MLERQPRIMTRESILKTIGEWMQSHQHINMSKEWCGLRDQLLKGEMPLDKLDIPEVCHDDPYEVQRQIRGIPQ